MTKEEMLRDIQKQRKYAPQFSWSGPNPEEKKRRMERLMVQRFIQGRFRGKSPYVRLDSCDPPGPDCELIDKEDKKDGAEVTELVDQAMVKMGEMIKKVATVKGGEVARQVFHGKAWTHDQVFEAVVKILETKERKLEGSIGKYGKLFLIIYTNEPQLLPDFCRAAFVGRALPKLRAIDEAFLLFRPKRSRYPDDAEAEFYPTEFLRFFALRETPANEVY